jgi:hypothetical protein
MKNRIAGVFWLIVIVAGGLVLRSRLIVTGARRAALDR